MGIPSHRGQGGAELCHLSAVLHKSAAVIEHGVGSWAATENIFGELEASRAAGFGRLAAYLYPNGEAERVTLAGCVLMYLFELDGDLVETPAIKGRASDAASQLLKWEAAPMLPSECAQPEDGPSQALLRLWRRIEEVSDAEVRNRLRLAWRTYAMGAAAEVAFLCSGTMPSPAEYDTLRAHTISDWPLVWIGITNGYTLPADLWHSVSVTHLNHLGQRLLGISNDIWSCQRERDVCLAAVNYPNVLAHHHRCSLIQGLRMTRELHQRVMKEFLATTEELERTGSPLVRRYTCDVTTLVAGWHRWCEVTSRYSPPSLAGAS